jgi:hypothetical protein
MGIPLPHKNGAFIGIAFVSEMAPHHSHHMVNDFVLHLSHPMPPCGVYLMPTKYPPNTTLAHVQPPMYPMQH